MQLGKALVGALIGGAVGIGALIGIYFLTGWDRAWLAILVALLTGLGVKWMVSTKGHPSYARGALTALIAILAFLAWYPIVAQITIRGGISQPIVAENRDATDNDRAADAANEPSEPAAPVEARRMENPNNAAGTGLRKPGNQQFSTWDFLWLCLAGLIAYELGRGTSTVAPASGAMGSPDDGPPTAAVEP